MPGRTDNPATITGANINTGLRFPADYALGSNYTIITFFRYTRINPLNIPTEIFQQSIALPLPYSGFTDNNQLKFTQESLGAIGGLAGGAAQVASAPTLGGKLSGIAGAVLGFGGSIAQQGLTSAAGRAGDAIDKGKGFNIGKVHIAMPTGASLGNVEAFAGQAAGLAVNPNLSLTFNGVNLRNHTFSWRLIAKNADESARIEQILLALRTAALPKKLFAANGNLEYPHIAKIQFNPDIIMFSKLGCFLEDIRVNYDGDGHPSFFQGTGKPVIVDITLSFTERAILTSDDYTEKRPIKNE